MATAPALSFDTLTTGVPIAIDGAPYEIRHPDRLSLAANLRLERDAPQIGALLRQVDMLSAEEEATLSALLARTCPLVLAAPADVERRLSDPQRVAILLTFTQLRRPRPLAVGAGAAGVAPAEAVAPGAVGAGPASAGKRSSRGSSASMGAPRTAGSRRSRSAS